jgi:hypothetical protein
MRIPVEIENIDELRRREGIDDAVLREEIRGLAIGDFVRLTLLTGPRSFETLAVRITRIRGSVFRGKLASRPASSGLAGLRAGASVVFTTAHIHSIAKRSPTHEP